MRMRRVKSSLPGAGISICKLLTRVRGREKQSKALKFWVGDGKNMGGPRMMTDDRADGAGFKGAGASEGQRRRSSLDAFVGGGRLDRG